MNRFIFFLLAMSVSVFGQMRVPSFRTAPRPPTVLDLGNVGDVFVDWSTAQFYVKTNGVEQTGWTGNGVNSLVQSKLDSLTVDTLADLLAISPDQSLGQVTISGRSAVGDGGGGVFIYDPNDSTTATNLGTVFASSDGKRWKRFVEGRIDVQWFGAKGDGSTDDTAAINAAFIAAEGSEIYFPKTASNYKVTAPLYFRQNTIIRIHGTIKAADGVNYEMMQNFGRAITIVGTDPVPAQTNVTFLGDGMGVIDGNALTANGLFNASGTAQWTGHALRILGVKGVVVNGLTIRDASLWALAIQACTDVKVVNCTIDTGNGNNTSYYIGKNQDGIHIFDSQNVVVANNVSMSSDDQIAVTARDCAVKNVVVANNVCLHRMLTTSNYFVLGSGLRISVEAGTYPNASIDSVTASGNDFRGGALGMYIDSGFGQGVKLSNIQILNNVIHDKITNGSAAYPATQLVFIQGVDNLTFADNRMNNFARQGLLLQKSSRIKIEGNSFSRQLTNDFVAGSAYAAINLGRGNGSITNVVIARNNFSELVGAAILGAFGSNDLKDIIVDDNRISFAHFGNTDSSTSGSRAAVKFGAVAGLKVSGNIIEDTSGVGVISYSGNGVEIANNIIQRCGYNTSFTAAYGIYCYTDNGLLTDTAIIRNNAIYDGDANAIVAKNIEKVFVINNVTRNNSRASSGTEISVNITGDSASLPVTASTSGKIFGNFSANTNAGVTGINVSLTSAPTFTGTQIVLENNTSQGLTTAVNVTGANNYAGLPTFYFNGQVALGNTTTNAAGWHYAKFADTSASSAVNALYIERTYSASTLASGTKNGLNVISRLGGSAGSSTTASGAEFFVSQDQTSGTFSAIRGVVSTPRITAAGLVTGGYGFLSLPIISGAGNFSTLYGFSAGAPNFSSTGVATTVYGFHAAKQKTTGVTTAYAFAGVDSGDLTYFAGPTSIGVAVGDATAALDVTSTTKGFLPPRMTKAQRDAISSPANGIVIYQTDNTPGIRFRDNGAWVKPTTLADP